MNLMYFFWLATVDGIGTRRISEIINYFGNIQNAWNAKYGDFKNVRGISSSIAEGIIKRRDEKKLLKEIKDMESMGINIITVDSEDYPENLKNIYDPPFILYTKGNMKKCSRYISIVGSRKCTSYGRMAARSISKLLCEYDIGIISGLARGIDTEAHMGALEGGGFTCGVLGCGCDVCYPPENKKLMMEIEAKGIIVSEYLPGTKPLPSNFPARNRIISGLSDGVLVIEAGEKSGALITANFGLEQGRDVFAVPGPISSECSKGSNYLIKDGAKLVTNIGDIISELGINIKVHTTNNIAIELTCKEKILMDAIDDSPIYIDDLLQKVSLKINEINYILTTLELKRIIKVLPGKYITRLF